MLTYVSAFSVFSFSKSRPSWSAHRGVPPIGGSPSCGARIFPNKKRKKKEEKKKEKEKEKKREETEKNLAEFVTKPND